MEGRERAFGFSAGLKSVEPTHERVDKFKTTGKSDNFFANTNGL